MRVALDVGSLVGPRTGIGVFTHALAEALASDPSVDLVGYAATWRGRNELATVVPANTTLARRPMAARPLRALWRRTDLAPIEWWTGPVDVVHGPNFVVPPARKAAAVVSVHDLTMVHFPEMCTADTLAYPDLIRAALRRGAWVHTDTVAVAFEVTELFGADPERVRCVPLAPSPIPDADPALGRRLAGAERFILALGTVEPRKDLPGLVAAFDELASSDPTLRLVVAGPDGWGADALTAAIDACSHRDRVVRLGWVDQAGRAALLRAATVLAYPSRYEGFGLPPLEAMSVGTPVVATDVPAVRETCGQGARYVPAGDTEALAEALAAVVNGGNDVDEQVATGVARAAQFNWGATTEQLHLLYRDAISEQRTA